MAYRPSWQGHLKLSLVTCPVALYTATNAGGDVHFHLINPDTNNRVKMITTTYVVSGVLLGVAGFFLADFSAVTLTLMGSIIFFFASAGASAVRLGEPVLRTSTAGAAALAVLSVRLGRW